MATYNNIKKIKIGDNIFNLAIPTKTSDLTNDSGFITNYTDTKNTAGSTNSTSKLYLIGATSQAANPQTYSNVGLYFNNGINSETSIESNWQSSISQDPFNILLSVSDNNTNDYYISIDKDSGITIDGVITPTQNTHAANKKYVDDAIGAITIPTISLNGSSTTSPSFYAPTSAGTSGQYLKSNGSGAPTWTTFPTIPTITDTYSATSSNGMSGKAVASALSSYLPLTGGTITGGLNIQNSQGVNQARFLGGPTYSYLELDANATGARVLRLASNTNGNIGLYDPTNSKWILHNDTSGNTHTNTLYLPHNSGVKGYTSDGADIKWLVSISNASGEDYIAVGATANDVPIGLYGSNVTLSRFGNLTLSGAALASGGLNNIRVGTTSSISVNASAYVDTSVTFSSAFSHVPFVICSILSESTGAGTGRMVASAINATKTGFTIRLFNGDTSTRAPAVTWLAYAVQG